VAKVHLLLRSRDRLGRLWRTAGAPPALRLARRLQRAQSRDLVALRLRAQCSALSKWRRPACACGSRKLAMAGWAGLGAADCAGGGTRARATRLALGAQALLARERLSQRVALEQQLGGGGRRALARVAPPGRPARVPRGRRRQEALLLIQRGPQAAVQLRHDACTASALAMCPRGLTAGNHNTAAALLGPQATLRADRACSRACTDMLGRM